MTPRVSVIIPTRNRLRPLKRAIASVEAQTFRDHELIVVDDASTDGTSEWLATTHGRMRTIASTTARGAGAARNRGIEVARGDVVAFLDDDDEWLPPLLEQQVGMLDAHPEAALTWAGHLEVDAAGRATLPDTQPLLAYSSPLVRMAAEAFIHSMSVVACRRAVFARCGSFAEHLKIVQDFEWYLRLLVAGEQFIHAPRILVGRTLPGGLVARHRDWHDEERRLLASILETGVPDSDARLIKATRSLFFARVGFAKGNPAWAVARLVDALTNSPVASIRVAALRLLRRLRRAERQDAPVAFTPVLS